MAPAFHSRDCRLAAFTILQGCFAICVYTVPKRSEWNGECPWEGTQGRVVKKGIIMAGKYTPLENYLRDLQANQKEVTLTFEQIERIINTRLPPSAYGYQQWWENEKEGNHVNARAWANAGWKVESVDFKRKQARFVRV